MFRGFLGVALYALTICLAGSVFTECAMAIEVRCVEGSQYEYLWRKFGHDRQKVADFLHVPASRVPAPTMCRAVLVTGTVGHPERGRLTRDDLLGEFDKLLAAIAQNDGWLATVYLASPGGQTVPGMYLGELTRLFWLKTRAVNGPVLKYVPDFAVAEGEGESTRHARTDVTRQPSLIRLAHDQRRCASACELIHVGGIDRRGITYVHRVRVISRIKPTLRVLELLATAGVHQLERSRAYLRLMGAGDDVIQKSDRTPAPLVNSAVTPRFPPTIANLLTSRCGAGVHDTAAREDRIAMAIEKAPANGEAAIGRLLNDLTRVRESKDGICIAATEERGRLSRYARYCSHGRCSRDVLLAQISRDLSIGITRSLAQDGHAWAQYELGSIYADGGGVSQNLAEAAKWLQRAADKGHTAAQYKLGVMYQNGSGVAQNYEEAVKWYRLAAEHGQADAQYSLGVMFEFGRGVPRDDVRAYMWYSLAAANGEKLALISRKGLAARMSVGQIAEAKALTRGWRSK